MVSTLSDLSDVIAAHRDDLLQRWFEGLVSREREQTVRFLTTTTDPFANPVSYAYRDGMAQILDGLASGRDGDELAAGIDRIVRIRAVQSRPPSDAVRFVTDLEEILRADVADLGDRSDVLTREISERTARLLMAAFDAYVACREEVFRIQVRQIRKTSLDRMEQLNEWRARRSGAAVQDSQ